MSKENGVSDERLAEIANSIKADCTHGSRVWKLADEIETILLDQSLRSKPVAATPQVLSDKAEALERSLASEGDGVNAYLRDDIEAAIDAMRSKPVAGVEVKPLEWKENSHTSVWTGELAFGVYYVAWDEGMGWRAFRKQFLSEASEVEIAYGDKATVLAAAESDYRNRIMSAITYSVEPEVRGYVRATLEAALKEA